MRLAFCLFKYFPYGGLERDFLRIATLCQARGHDITVFTQAWQGDIPEGFKVNILPLRHWTNHGKAREFADQVLGRLHREEFDRVVGFNKMPGLDFYYAADPCYRQRMDSGYVGLNKLNPRYRAFATLEEAVFSVRSDTQILLLCAAHRDIFQQYYGTPSERFHQLPPGIARDRVAPVNAAEIRAAFRAEFGLAHDDQLLLHIGSGFKTKGLDRILPAMAALPTELGRKTRLIVLGQDDARSYLRMAKRLGLDERLSILGGRDDVPRFLLGADILLHPARSEVTGTVLLEAIAAGLPVLTTAVCGYAYHITDADAGRVVAHPFQQQELNEKLHEMLTSEDKHRWPMQALNYAKTIDLHGMPQRVVEIIEMKFC